MFVTPHPFASPFPRSNWIWYALLFTMLISTHNSNFKLIFKKNHSQIIILFTTSVTAVNIFRIEALYLLYFSQSCLSIFINILQQLLASANLHLGFYWFLNLKNHQKLPKDQKTRKFGDLDPISQKPHMSIYVYYIITLCMTSSKGALASEKKTWGWFFF